jgi:hypothetical protein
MDRKAIRALTPEEAKWRLRQAASELGLGQVVKRHPLESLAISLLAGFVMARNQPSTRAMLRLVPTLLRYL